VAASGDVYYARGGPGCGDEVELLRYRAGAGSRLVHTFPPGHDLRFTATIRIGTRQRVLFDGVDCPAGFDILALDDRP
jgi:hypothetical protein